MTNDISKAKDVLFDSCSIVAEKVGNELFILKDSIWSKYENETLSIYKLFSGIRELICEEMYNRYDYIFDTERVARLLNDPAASTIDPEFQLKIPGSDVYEPYQFSIVRNNDSSLIVIRRTDRFYNVIESAMGFFSHIMEKILKANITKDTYKEIKKNDNLSRPDKLSEWIHKFAKYNIAEDDQNDFLSYFDKLVDGSLYSRYGDIPRAVVYRRCVNSAEYRWSIMYAVPTINYSDDNKEMYIYVIDIQDHYIIQAQRARRLGTDQYYDLETGIHNKRAFQNRIARLHGQKVGLVYICLKDETPDGYDDYTAYRKSVVNDLIEEYGEDVCYRMSDKEFLVLLVGCHKTISTFANDVYFGYSFANGPEEYSIMYDMAVEDAMQ